MFDTISLVNQDNAYITHREAINRLIKEPSVQIIITKEGTLDLKLSDLDLKSVQSEKEHGTRFSCGSLSDAPFIRTRLSCDGSDVSSVMLSPIAKVPVVDTDSSCRESSEIPAPAAE